MTSTYFLTTSRLFGRLRRVSGQKTMFLPLFLLCHLTFPPLSLSNDVPLLQPALGSETADLAADLRQRATPEQSHCPSSLPMDPSACGGKLTFDLPTTPRERLQKLSIKSTCNIDQPNKTNLHWNRLLFTTRNAQLISPDAQRNFRYLQICL